MKKSRRKKRSAFTNLIIVLLSIIVILASILIIKKIIIFVSDVKIDNNNVKFGSTEATAFETNNAKRSMFIQDNKGTKYKKDDNTFATNEWIEIDNNLYRFDKDSYTLSGDFYENGQIFTFENGKLVKIQKDEYYINPDKKYFSSSYSDEYVVFLSEKEEIEKFYPIKYKHLDDNESKLGNSNFSQDDISNTKSFNADVSDTEKEPIVEEKVFYLGGENKKQYSSKNLLQIDSNYIYFLCIGTEEFCGKVNKMRMNSSIKETFGSNVEGYIAKNGSLWYYENNEIKKALRGDKEGVAVNKILQDKIKPLETTEDVTEEIVEPFPIDVNDGPFPVESIKSEIPKIEIVETTKEVIIETVSPKNDVTFPQRTNDYPYPGSSYSNDNIGPIADTRIKSPDMGSPLPNNIKQGEYQFPR